MADTSNLISSVLSPDSHGGTLRAFVESAELLDEPGAKMSSKPYVAARISASEADAFIWATRSIAVLLPPLDRPAPAVGRDPKDDYLLAQAVLAPADNLVTGEVDLLALGDAVAPLRIVRAATFVREVRQTP